MNIIVDIGKKEEILKISKEAFLCVVPSFLIKLHYKKILRHIGAAENDKYYAAENINPKMLKALSSITAFSEINTSEIFFERISSIIKNISMGEKMNISIYSQKEDERIFRLISSVNNFCSVIYLITQSDDFYEKAARYTLTNYGIAVNLKKFTEANRSPVNIVLNSQTNDFSDKNGYVINLSDTDLKAKNLLFDISPLDIKKHPKTNIKKCCFWAENSQNFNLIWKNSQKVVDKSKK